MMNYLKNAAADLAADAFNAIENMTMKNNASGTRDKNQIAGHDADEFGRKRLFFKDDKVYKLYDPDDARGKREWEFYELVKQKCPEILGTIIPMYYGAEIRTEEGATKPGNYLVMENSFKCLDGDTCLADIKIGKPITKFDREENALPIFNDAAKLAYARMATPGLTRNGFQVLGVKIKNLETNTWEKYGKSLGRADNILGVEYIVEKFLKGSDYKGSPYRDKIIQHLTKDLNRIQEWLSKQTYFKFRGSSLVLAYLPPDNEYIQALINRRKSSAAAHQQNQQNTRTSSSSPTRLIEQNYSTQGIPLAGSNIIPNSSSTVTTDTQITQNMPVAGCSIETYDKPLAVVRLIDFNNFENQNEIDKESLWGVKNLIRYFSQQS